MASYMDSDIIQLLENSFIRKIRLFEYIENFTSKNWNFLDKKNRWYFSYFYSET